VELEGDPDPESLVLAVPELVLEGGSEILLLTDPEPLVVLDAKGDTIVELDPDTDSLVLVVLEAASEILLLTEPESLVVLDAKGDPVVELEGDPDPESLVLPVPELILEG
jgi:hypothetical protein